MLNTQMKQRDIRANAPGEWEDKEAEWDQVRNSWDEKECLRGKLPKFEANSPSKSSQLSRVP